jgi:hypothetical protein
MAKFLVTILILVAIISGAIYFARVNNQRTNDIQIQAVVSSTPQPRAQVATTTATSTADWKTYRNKEFGFQIKNLDSRVDFQVFVDTTSTLSYGWAGGNGPSFELDLYHDPARFHQFIYNPHDDANEDLTYAPAKQQWIVKSRSDQPACPIEEGDGSYRITTGHHAGDDYFVYVTSKGMIAFLGGDNIEPGTLGPELFFDHPESVLKATCRVVK